MKTSIIKKILATGIACALTVAMVACGAPQATQGPVEGTAAEETSAATAEEPSAEGGKTIKVGLSMGTLQTDFTIKLATEIENAADGYDNVELTTISADGDANKQAMNIDNFVTMGMDAILVYPVEPEVCADAMKRAREAGIYVVIVDQIPEDRDSFDIGISVSMHDLGVGVCEMASDWIDVTFPDAENGSVKCATIGVWATEQFAERCDVFNEIANYNSKAVLVDSYDVGIANFMTETAQDVEILLQKHPDINVIMCFTDAQAVIAEEAIEKNKEIYGLDTEKIGIFTVDHSTASFELLAKSADKESCLLGITTTNLGVGKIMFDCGMKTYDISNLEDGKILYQPITKISTENMEDYRQYILGNE